MTLTAPHDAILPRATGRVVDRIGDPIVGVEVQYAVPIHIAPDTDSWSGPEDRSTTDTLGQFAFERVPVAAPIVVVAVGDDIVVQSQRFEPVDVRAGMTVTVERLCRFRVITSPPDADRIRLLDEDGNVVKIQERRGRTRTQHRSITLVAGRTPILAATDRAVAIEFAFADGREPARTAIALSPVGCADLGL